MRSQEVARRYAVALYQLAADRGAIDSVEEELRTVVEQSQQTREIARYLAHPLLPRGQKEAFVEALFPDLSPTMHNLFGLLIRNRRESYLDLIYSEFLAVRAKAEDQVPVCVATAETLSEDERRSLIARLEEGMHRRVKLEERIDEWLLGGARIEIEGRVLDGSLRARLHRLKAELES